MKALIASGAGRYADPWHPFPETSPRIGAVLAEAGFDVQIDDDVDAAMTRLSDVDLLVVNAGDPWRDVASQTTSAPVESIEGFATALEWGIGVLAFHCAVSSLRDYPEWAPAVGAMWVPGLSWHPPASTTTIRGKTLPGGTPVEDITVFDERYCRLQRLGRSDVVAVHDGDGEDEAAAWTREFAASRIAVDLLGHDERSYFSAEHGRLIARLALWAASR